MTDIRQQIHAFLSVRPPQTLTEIRDGLHLNDVQTMEVARMLRDGAVRYSKVRRGPFKYEVVDKC